MDYRNLKFTKKLAGEDKPKSYDINVTFPDNWDLITQIIETKGRELARTITWTEADAALTAAEVPNKTEALLILKTKGIISAKIPRKGVDY